AEEKLKAQKTIAHDIVAACVAVPHCSGITVWGFMDEHSWLNQPRWAALRGRMPHYPLPFDSAYSPKPFYQGMVDALEGR
ncbi:MAG: endo-1,4-beta-xylanase, partial [Myxococcales bacterium]|nr:endo-1,4-beta-xylanase [Myxococcales bacterium]